MPIRFTIRVGRGDPSGRADIAALLNSIFANEQQIAVQDFLARTAQPQPKVPQQPKFPSPPQTGRPPIFGPGPAANDPVFGILGKIARRGLGALGAVLGGIDLIRLIQERGIEQLLEDLLAEAVVGARRARILTERKPREVIIPSDPIPAPPPQDPILLPRPRPFPIPGRVPIEFPDIPVSIPIPIPSLPRAPAPAPVPPPQRLPSPLPTPAPNIRVFPLGLPFPGGRPLGLPSPRSVPLGDPLPLTPSSPGVPLSPLGFAGPLIGAGAQPQPQPAQERCQVVKRRRRKKGRCREGFFRERPGETEFVTWRSRPCGPRI